MNDTNTPETVTPSPDTTPTPDNTTVAATDTTPATTAPKARKAAKKVAKKVAKKAGKKAAKAAPAKKVTVVSGAKRGRPQYQPRFPRKVEWTVTDFCVANDVDPATGKGPRCSRLTLVKWLDRDRALKGRSVAVRLDKLAEPKSENGLGRKAFMFSLREKLANASVSPANSTPADSAPAGSSYDDVKATLGLVPAVDIADGDVSAPAEAVPAAAVPA